MPYNSFVKNLLREELRFQTRLPDDKIEDIVDSFISRLFDKRHAVVLTFLNDAMYQAVQTQNPNIDYQTANQLYISAVKEYNSKPPVIDSKILSDEDWYSR
jgi:hypothetical protein